MWRCLWFGGLFFILFGFSFGGGEMSGLLQSFIILLGQLIVSIVPLDIVKCFNAHTHKSIRSDYRLTTGANSDLTSR